MHVNWPFVIVLLRETGAGDERAAPGGATYDAAGAVVRRCGIRRGGRGGSYGVGRVYEVRGKERGCEVHGIGWAQGTGWGRGLWGRA